MTCACPTNITGRAASADAVRGHRRQAADGADFAIGKCLFAINLRRVHGCLSAVGGGTHAWATPSVVRKQRPTLAVCSAAWEALIRYLAWHTRSQLTRSPRGPPSWALPCSGWRCFGCTTCSANITGRTSSRASRPFPTRNCCGRRCSPCAGYGCLTLYDALAVRFAGARVPYPRIALISFMGYAIGHNVGLQYLERRRGPLSRVYRAWVSARSRSPPSSPSARVTFLLGAGLLLGTVAVDAGRHVRVGAACARVARHDWPGSVLLAGGRARICGWSARATSRCAFAAS